jgi:hypothetical protein
VSWSNLATSSQITVTPAVCLLPYRSVSPRPTVHTEHTDRSFPSDSASGSIHLGFTWTHLPFQHRKKSVHLYSVLEYRCLSLYALPLSALSHIAVLFQYHEHQYPIRGHGRSCHAGPLSCARSFTDLPHHFDSRDYKLRPLMPYHSENTRACCTFPLYVPIRRNSPPRIPTVTYTQSLNCSIISYVRPHARVLQKQMYLEINQL